MEITLRNEKAIFKRIYQLTESHIDRIEGIDPDEMTTEDKIKTVQEYYKQATDKNNPLRGNCVIDDSMFGRMVMGTIQSYDIMDNPKYRDIKGLLSIINETFEHQDGDE